MANKKSTCICKCLSLAPHVRLELTTLRLTAECSAIELLRNKPDRMYIYIRSVLVFRRRLIFPGAGAPSIVSAKELNFCVRYGYRWDLFAITTGNCQGLQPQNFTLRFARLKNAPSCTIPVHTFLLYSSASHLTSLVLRDQALDRLVLASSHVTVFTPPTYLPCSLHGVLLPFGMAYLFLRSVSRLDAFSVYPIRTSLPSYAVGTTTVAPEVRPFRSSRTRNSSSHVSCAHDG